MRLPPWRQRFLCVDACRVARHRTAHRRRIPAKLIHLPRLLTASPNRMLVHFAETMVFAAIGGTAFGLAGIPGGWLSGSILCVAVAALSGRPMHVPLRLNRVIFVLIGTSLGAVVTPETVQGITTYPLSIAMLIVAIKPRSRELRKSRCLVSAQRASLGWRLRQPRRCAGCAVAMRRRGDRARRRRPRHRDRADLARRHHRGRSADGPCRTRPRHAVDARCRWGVRLRQDR